MLTSVVSSRVNIFLTVVQSAGTIFTDVSLALNFPLDIDADVETSGDPTWQASHLHNGVSTLSNLKFLTAKVASKINKFLHL